MLWNVITPNICSFDIDMIGESAICYFTQTRESWYHSISWVGRNPQGSSQRTTTNLNHDGIFTTLFFQLLPLLIKKKLKKITKSLRTHHFLLLLFFSIKEYICVIQQLIWVCILIWVCTLSLKKLILSASSHDEENVCLLSKFFETLEFILKIQIY